MKRITLLLLFGLFISTVAAAADLTNADVKKMLAAGLPESVVIQTIDAADPPAFDMTADGLIALKKAGASDAVILKIIARQSSKSQPSVSAQATASGGACKLEAPGGLFMRASDTLLPMRYQTAKVDQNTGGLVGNFFTAGIAKVKSKTTLRIDRVRSSLRITDRQPQILDLLAPVGYSAENFYVVRLTVKDKTRFVQIGSSEANLVGASSSSWIMPDNIRVAMTADTLSSQCTYEGKLYSHYRIRPSNSLENGEYAFVQGTPDNRAIIMFDFGVD